MNTLVFVVSALACLFTPQDVPITGKYPVILEEPLGDPEMGRIDAMERAVAEATAAATPETTALLTRGLADPSRFVRYKALEFLGRYRDQETVPALIATLHTAQTEVDEHVMPVVFADSRAGTTPPQPIVSSCVPMMALATHAVAHQGDEAASRALIALAAKRKVDRTPGAVVRALGESLARIGTYEAMQAAVRWHRDLANALAAWEKAAKKRGARPELPFALRLIYKQGDLATVEDSTAISAALTAAFQRVGLKPPANAGWRDWSDHLARHRDRFPPQSTKSGPAAPPTDKAGRK